jgi:methionine synthase II (cobalamin-independent)
MPLLTTTIGAFPKPDYVTIPDWFRSGNTAPKAPTEAYEGFLENQAMSPEKLLAVLDKATREVVQLQVDAGIDIPTDGEIRRENYIHYHCRHVNGVDFEELTEKAMRNEAWTARVPTITSELSAKEPFLVRDWQIAQSVTDKPVKITLPGPMTVADTTADRFYNDPKKLGAAWANVLNAEIHALVEAGCTWIQVDEPLFARKPAETISYGLENLERCFHGVPEHVHRAMHMCCGYPDVVDETDYEKANPDAYMRIADGIDTIGLHAISIEDAHQHNDLTLLDKFQKTSIIFGVVAIAKTRVESVEEILSRIKEALEHIDKERLIVAPDCGLGMLDSAIAVAKMRNLSQAAKLID